MASEKPYRILFLGDSFHGSTSVQRVRAFKQLCHEVQFLPREGGFQSEKSWYRRLRHRLRIPCESSRENARLMNAVASFEPDVVWIEKGLTVRLSTLRRIKLQRSTALVVSFSADDMLNPHNQSLYWRRCFPYYDVHVTTKTPNIDEFIHLGARNVVFMAKSYDPSTHRPIELSEDDLQQYHSDVTFIGSFERERFESMSFLAARGITVRVWGNGWSGLISPSPNLRFEGKPLYGDDYAKAINAAKISLCFLRKMNRDRQTARSVEIPACGAFMLAERTEEHQALFQEGIEAAYFGSNEELAAQVHRYLTRDDERIRVARSGHQRCLDSGYSHASRLESVLRACFLPKPSGRQHGPFNQVWRAF